MFSISEMIPMQQRKSRAKTADDHASLFIRKAYHAVSNCPEHIGGWSEKGDSFVVKDAKVFSEEVIPTVYKHNNFSSFVRQLNFYGFRKIKTDLSSIDNPWWEFRHSKFIRGMPHLLPEIRRADHCAAQPTEDSDGDKHELLAATVSELKEKLSIVDKALIELTHIVSNFIRESNMREIPNGSLIGQPSTSSIYDNDPLAAGKKRRNDPDAETSPRNYQRIEESSEDLGSSTATIHSNYCEFERDSSSDDESLTDLITLCEDDRLDADNVANFNEVEINSDFEDFLAFAAALDEGLCGEETMIAYIDENDASVSDVSSTEDCNYGRVRARTLSISTRRLRGHEIPFVITLLPLSMQSRFLMKFSEAAEEKIINTRGRALSAPVSRRKSKPEINVGKSVE